MLTGDFTPKKQNKTYNSIHIRIITTYGILMSGCQTLLKHYNFTEKLKIKVTGFHAKILNKIDLP